MRYKPYNLPRFTSVDSLVNELRELGSGKYEPGDVRSATEVIHKRVSKALFQALNEKDYNEVAKILSYKDLSKKELVNVDGYNVVEYLLYNSVNSAFITLYRKHIEQITYYFTNIPILFTIILGKKNFELISFFLRDDFFRENLKKEHISNAFFIAVEGGQTELVEFIAKDYECMLDIRSIEATMIYFIGNDKVKELEIVFSQENLIAKFSEENVEKMIGYAVLNKNVAIVKFMIMNPYFASFLESGDQNMQKVVLNLVSDKLLN
ncbi:MAG: hypothetical protein LBH46_02965 [Rickettsiales bacterium]|nr:hypothetical protein [Rickettsiales bacterium]